MNDIAKLEEKLSGSYGFVYITTNLTNGKKYIGQKKYDSGSRWKSYLGSGYHLINAIKLYGRENFKREILDIAKTEEELNQKEAMWIKKYNAVNDDNFYNMIDGGNVQDSLTRKNSHPLVCIDNNTVFRSIADASKWSGYTPLMIKKTFTLKHDPKSKKDGLIFRPLNFVKEKHSLCVICGDNFLKSNNVQKKCKKCSHVDKFKVYHDFDKSKNSGVITYKLTDSWVKKEILRCDKVCRECGLFFEKTKKYQRKCDSCSSE